MAIFILFAFYQISSNIFVYITEVFGLYIYILITKSVKFVTYSLLDLRPHIDFDI